MTDDPDADTPAKTEAAEANARLARLARNVASIASVPWEELPDGPARFCLLDMAYAGGDVGAYRAEDGRWCVRVGSRSETCAAWAKRFSM